MKITEEYKKNGYFWLVEKPDNKMPGLLTVSEDGTVNLEVMGLLDAFEVVLNQKPKPNFRLGGLVDNGYVTLENCYYKNSNIKLGNESLSNCIIHANYLLDGLWYGENEAVVFDSFEFTFDGLTEWLDKSSAEVDFSGDYRSGVLKFSQNASIGYYLKEYKLEICFYSSYPLGATSTGFNLRQNAFIRISTNGNKQKLVDIHQIISKLYNLFCLAIDKSTSLLSLVCFNSDNTQDDESKRPVPVKIYFYSACYSKTKLEIQWFTSLFGFKEVESTFDVLLKNWLWGYEVYEPSLTLYFASKRASVSRYAEDDFIYMVHALESLHRRISDETELPQDEFKKLFKEITTSVDKKYKQLICERLNYGNELSLLKRLKRIFSGLSEYGVMLKDYEDDFKKIKDTRNYLTHYDAKLSDKKANPQEMMLLTRKMEGLFQLYLLKELGFTATEIQTKISNGHNQLRHKLGL